MNFNCLILTKSQQTVDEMFKMSHKNDMALMRTNGVVEFLHEYACINPELTIIDYDSFNDVSIINKMLELSVKSLRGTLIFTNSDKEFYGFKVFRRLEELEDEIVVRKMILLNSRYLVLSDEESMHLRSIISDYLVDYGYLPKYQGFVYLKEVIYINLTNQIVDKNLSKGILPLVAKKYFTTKNGVEQALKTLISSRNKNSKKYYPYGDKPSIKEVVNYISEMLYNDLPTELKINS